MTLVVEIELAGATVDTDMLMGFLAVSPTSPDNYRGATVDGDTLRLDFDGEPSSEAFAELLRVLGGSAAGDRPMTVRSPALFAGLRAIPGVAAGPARWECPRCAATVLEGANDQPGLRFGLCLHCGAADRGEPVSEARPLAQAPTATVPPPAPARPRAPEPEPAPTPTAAADAIDYADLPHPPPRPGIVLVLRSGQLAWSTATDWRVVDGAIPPAV